MENLWNNLKNKLKTHCKRNSFNKVVLGLSGGIDSAIVAILAADSLGCENVTAIMMKTKYTSDLSIEIAQEIAKLNNIKYLEIDIDNIVNDEIKILEDLFQSKVKNIVIENLQARIRGQILMAYSNQNGNMVLACGNKSEKLTGYCTLYGDTCGGIMPIGNLYKTQVFELAKWRNTINQVLPNSVLTRAPSAELSFNQKDENTLPPYPILDKILKMLNDDKMSISEIYNNGYNEKLVKQIDKMIKRSKFKSTQMPKPL